MAMLSFGKSYLQGCYPTIRDSDVSYRSLKDDDCLVRAATSKTSECVVLPWTAKLSVLMDHLMLSGLEEGVPFCLHLPFSTSDPTLE